MVVSATQPAQVEHSISELQVIVRKVEMCARRALSFSRRLWVDESYMLLHVGLDNVTWKWRGLWIGATKQLCFSVFESNA